MSHTYTQEGQNEPNGSYCPFLFSKLGKVSNIGKIVIWKRRAQSQSFSDDSRYRGYNNQ